MVNGRTIKKGVLMSSYWTVDDDSVDLAHFGVKGMKWGVRK